MTQVDQRKSRKCKIGVVVSNKMSRTVVVQVERTFRHPVYNKVVKGTKKYYAHDENASSRNQGDRVLIMECRPISKLKRWRVVSEGAAGKQT
jgi:small subunit ribosomal protein S17